HLHNLAKALRDMTLRTARHWPYNRPQVPTATARLRDQEPFSISASCYFRAQALPSRRRSWSTCDAFDLGAVIAGFADNLRKLPFPETGSWPALGISDCRQADERRSEPGQQTLSKHYGLQRRRRVERSVLT